MPARRSAVRLLFTTFAELVVFWWISLPVALFRKAARFLLFFHDLLRFVAMRSLSSLFSLPVQTSRAFIFEKSGFQALKTGFFRKNRVEGRERRYPRPSFFHAATR